ncbi:alpha/beta-Hydrolases superfamily protein [Striga asiatica]|uniref:Alpha/beta-Hydrolases superfamily protein n=1 Tax=Striga asiatica TaxID=4170 RepID=A0A5A7QR31_STRAF|nr:alpha/beta-Hydrolases superfamily protein [Striga asiatica]
MAVRHPASVGRFMAAIQMNSTSFDDSSSPCFLTTRTPYAIMCRFDLSAYQAQPSFLDKTFPSNPWSAINNHATKHDGYKELLGKLDNSLCQRSGIPESAIESKSKQSIALPLDGERNASLTISYFPPDVYRPDMIDIFPRRYWAQASLPLIHRLPGFIASIAASRSSGQSKDYDSYSHDRDSHRLYNASLLNRPDVWTWETDITRMGYPCNGNALV